MRVILFFDLPSVTYHEQKAYRKFRKFLINEGFIQMQESVYTKLALNQSTVNSVEAKVRENRPPRGLVQVLTITEKQYTHIEFIRGERSSNCIDSEARLIVI